MSKTFKSRNIGMKNTFAVRDSGGGVHFTVTNNDGKVAGCDLANADTLAIALAVIESAYPPADYVLDGSPESFLAVAASYLRKASRAIESKAKEAADREALYAEARALFGARHHSPGALEWEDSAQAQWLDVARKARELHRATK